jgi:hypothetical protein
MRFNLRFGESESLPCTEIKPLAELMQMPITIDTGAFR